MFDLFSFSQHHTNLQTFRVVFEETNFSQAILENLSNFGFSFFDSS